MARFEQRLQRNLTSNPEFREGFEEGELEFLLVQALEAARVEQGLSKAELADRMGMKRPFVSRKLNHPENMEVSTLVAFLRGLGKRAEIVITDAEGAEPTLQVSSR
jgi:transcriptional regulator with XRE-family HTH domain